jgi:hypothetical protein
VKYDIYMCEIPRRSPLDSQYALKNLKDGKVKQVLSMVEYQWKGEGEYY